MATYKHATGSISVLKTVEVTGAFVQNSFVEAEIEQPAGSILRKVELRCVSEPTVTTTNTDLGYKVGTTTSTTVANGADELAEDLDGIINAAANTTALKTGAIIACTLNAAGLPTTAASATTGTNRIGYTDTARTLFCNTLASNHAIAAAGTVQWILYFDIVA